MFVQGFQEHAGIFSEDVFFLNNTLFKEIPLIMKTWEICLDVHGQVTEIHNVRICHENTIISY